MRMSSTLGVLTNSETSTVTYITSRDIVDLIASLDMENFLRAIGIGIESGYSYISVWCYILGKYSLRFRGTRIVTGIGTSMIGRGDGIG